LHIQTTDNCYDHNSVKEIIGSSAKELFAFTVFCRFADIIFFGPFQPVSEILSIIKHKKLTLI